MSLGGVGGVVGVKFGHKGTFAAVLGSHMLSVQIVPALQTMCGDVPRQDLKLYGPVQMNKSAGEHSPEQCVEQSAVNKSLGV